MLSNIPKLIQLITKRKALIDEADPEAKAQAENYWDFRMGVTLQDLAYCKIELINPEDALLHLRASEDILRNIKSKENTDVTPLLLKTANERNHRLFKEAKQELEEKQKRGDKPIPDPRDAVRRQ